MSRGELMRLSYWFPLIEAAGLPVPLTRIIRADGPLHEFMEGRKPECLARLVESIAAAGSEVGVPFFLRTDYMAGKHDWTRTCYVADPSKLAQHIFHLWETSEVADFFGFPTDVWAVRELLQTDAAFRAFRGMPITREFRFFVRDGVVEHVQPYWPAHAIQRPTREDWRDRLAEMNQLDDGTRAELEAMTLRVNAAVPGFWSVDWLLTADRGWVLTDMATGDRSFRWNPNEPIEPMASTGKRA